MDFIKAVDIPKRSKIWKVSNPIKAQKKAFQYLGDDAILYLSDKEDKKYMIYDPTNDKMVHFGDINYEDFLKHRNLSRRDAYISRAKNIKGDWKNNKYSSNNLSIHINW